MATALLGAGLLVPAEAQRAEPLPSDLRGVGVTEHLDGPIPLQLEFTDESGERVVLGEYFRPGRPVLLVLAYYRCPMLCTLVLNGLIDGLRGIDWVPGEAFEIVTVSIDPLETPTLAALKKQTYLASYGEPRAAAGWHFLTGREADIRVLADALGFAYRRIEERGDFAHPAVLFVGTPDGRISRYLYGVRFEPRTLRLSLVEASAGKIGTTLDRLLLYCYHYDPAAGAYAPMAMNIMRVAAAATALVLGGALLVLWLRDTRRRKLA